MQSLREHDVYQEVAEDERWTVLSDKIIPGKSVLTIKIEGTKKVRVVGFGNFQQNTGLAVFTVKVNVITVRVVMLNAGTLGWSLISGRSGGSPRETFTFAVAVGFHEERSFVETQEGSLWASFSSKSLVSHKDAVLAVLVMCLEGREYVLRQSCADLALWIIVWLGAETGLLFFDDQGQAIGSVAGLCSHTCR